MFEYLINARSFKIKLGNYVSHEVLYCYDEKLGNRRFRTVEELNSLDRKKLALEFYNSDRCYIEGGIDTEDIQDDIAHFIDKSIPKAYAKHNLKIDKVPSVINAEDLGLVYQYKEITTDKDFKNNMRHFFKTLVDE